MPKRSDPDGKLERLRETLRSSYIAARKKGIDPATVERWAQDNEGVRFAAGILSRFQQPPGRTRGSGSMGPEKLIVLAKFLAAHGFVSRSVVDDAESILTDAPSSGFSYPPSFEEVKDVVIKAVLTSDKKITEKAIELLNEWNRLNEISQKFSAEFDSFRDRLADNVVEVRGKSN